MASRADSATFRLSVIFSGILFLLLLIVLPAWSAPGDQLHVPSQPAQPREPVPFDQDSDILLVMPAAGAE